MKKNLFLFAFCSFILSLSLANAQQTANYANYNNGSEYRAQSHSQINWLNSYEAAVAQSRSSSKPILILFTGTNWCPACMKLERHVLTAAPFAQSLANRLIFLKAEFPSYTAESMESSPFNSLLNRYRVDTFPTMVVVNAEGAVLFNVNYQNGGVETYVQEITSKLSQVQRSN